MNDQYFIGIAENAALLSTCLGQSVGACLVIKGRVIAVGSNTQPKGWQTCLSLGYCHSKKTGTCLESRLPSRAIHAEVNALGSASILGESTAGATCYITHRPCNNCLKSLVAAGVVRLVYPGEPLSQEWQDSFEIILLTPDRYIDNMG